MQVMNEMDVALVSGGKIDTGAEMAAGAIMAAAGGLVGGLFGAIGGPAGAVAGAMSGATAGIKFVEWITN